MEKNDLLFMIRNDLLTMEQSDFLFMKQNDFPSMEQNKLLFELNDRKRSGPHGKNDPLAMEQYDLLTQSEFTTFMIP